jgi:hypothetical protein
MLQKFYLDFTQWLQVFFHVFFANVSYICFKCFICLQTYVASVASICFKNRSGGAHVAMCVRSGRGASSPLTRGLAVLAASGPRGPRAGM